MNRATLFKARLLSGIIIFKKNIAVFKGLKQGRQK
jgi:hypothetical protein